MPRVKLLVLGAILTAAMLAFGGAVAWRFGRKPLQSVAKDLTLRLLLSQRPSLKQVLAKVSSA